MIVDFNKNWKFDKSSGESCIVDLSHDAMLTEPRRATSRSGVQGGHFAGGKYTYSNNFRLTSCDIGKNVQLLFEGVYQNATVTVNGRQVAFHKYGYTEFYADISDVVVAGTNTVVVYVNNTLVPNCRWYTGSGIYRPVSLIIRDKSYIKKAFVKTVSYSPAIIDVSAETSVDMDLACEIYEGSKLVASGKVGEIAVPNAKLWSAETPHIYTLKVAGSTDTYTTTFGIRKIEWSAENGLTVNGDVIKMKGGCIHHDNGVLGAVSHFDAEYRRVKILKEQGFNALRVSHNPASRYLLDACDELGMYVIDECFDGWYIPKDYHDNSRAFWDNWQDDLRSMVNKDINHPSVIMYSMGNEVTETAEDKGIKLLADMRDFVKSIDNTRPITCGINVLLNVYVQLGMGVYKDKGGYKAEPLPENKKYKERKAGSAFFNAVANKLGWLMQFMSKGKRAERIVAKLAPSVDIVGLNYASSRYDTDVKKYPNRLMMGSETMAGDLPYNWQRVEKYSQVLGDFVWSAWDYLGEACIGDWTYHSYKGLPFLAGQGMVDITGKPLASMAYMQTVWGMRGKPFICVRPLNHARETPSTSAWQFTNAIESWNWHSYEFTKAVVEVFSNAHSVRLELNGKVVGTRKLKKYKTKFAVRYQQGALVAVALDDNGNEVSRSILNSGDNKTQLSVVADKNKLKVDQLAFVEIEFTDSNGNLLPYIEQRVDVEVVGENVKLLGFGSALCKTDEVFDKIYHKSYRGRCLAVLQGKTAGKATFIVKSANVSTSQIEFVVN